MAVSVLVSCSPAARFDRSASKLEFQRSVIEGNGFDHVVYSVAAKRSSRLDEEIRVLHVYLGGDGTPWVTPVRVASDPTPRTPLTLRLMALDPATTVYLGRPCYHGLAKTTLCSPAIWTNLRYSEAVVTSMTDALKRVLAEASATDVVFFGYSGGGTLAMLIAERVEQTRAVVTVAANLDTDTWTAHHGYTALHGSLNPVKRLSLPAEVTQLHYLGANDSAVPPHLFDDWLHSRTHPTTRVTVVPNYTHACCWEDLWPEVLDQVQTAISAASN